MADLRSWTQPSPFGAVTIVVGDAGLRSVSLPGSAVPPEAHIERDDETARQFDEWFAGRRHDFDLMLDLEAIDGFRLTVLETLRRDVPWGETVSYGELAQMAGRPRAARAVGRTMATNPLPFVIPCHRVVAAGGKIGGYGSGANAIDLKRALLAREGVTTFGRIRPQ
jgi:methylated-DNA-[protein]-cysteine S-methyltransferase